jgi:hypothetical protein
MSLAAALVALTLHGPIVNDRMVEPSRRAGVRVAQSWDDLDQSQRDRALRNYQHYMELPADKRKSIDQHYEQWKKMPRDDRDRARRKHDQYRGLGIVGD